MEKHFTSSASSKQDSKSSVISDCFSICKIVLFQMRHGLIFISAILLLSTHLFGCATAGPQLSENIVRYPPEVQLGEELILLNNEVKKEYGVITSLIDMDGKAQVFAIDSNDQLHHIEVLGDNSITNESLGVIEIEDDVVLLDAIEHPTGTLRVLANNKQYIRSYTDPKWQEMGGNRCARFVSAGDELYCAFVTKGEEISTPKRKDITAGLIAIFPIFWWKNVQVAKLVLAQETPEGWVIRAVLDQDTDWDANNGFMVDSDNSGKIHFLYYASKGGSWFWFGGAPEGGGGALGGKFYQPELRYAQVDIDQLLLLAAADMKEWSPINGITLTTLPFAGHINYGTCYRNEYGFSPNKFGVNKLIGDIEGLIDTMLPKNLFVCYDGLLDLSIHEGQWSASYKIMMTKDFTENYDWDTYLISNFKKDYSGNSHVLSTGMKSGFWKGYFFIAYQAKKDDKWSNSLILGNRNSGFRDPSLAIAHNGDLFVSWINAEGKLTGRWIRPRKENLQ